MELNLTAEWQPFSEGDEDEFLSIAGMRAHAWFRGDVWVWEVRTSIPGVLTAKTLGEGWVDSKDEAKSAAEARIRAAVQRGS